MESHINNMQVKVNLLARGLNFQPPFLAKSMMHCGHWFTHPLTVLDKSTTMSILTWDQSPDLSSPLGPNFFRTERSGWKGDGGWHPTMQNDLNHPSVSTHSATSTDVEHFPGGTCMVSGKEQECPQRNI